MKLITTLALLLLSSLYFSHGEESTKPPTLEHGGKTRGEMLAVETNSELISSSVQPSSDKQSQCSQDGTKCLSCRSVGMCKGGVLTEIPCRGLYSYCDARTGTCTSERRRCQGEDRQMNCPGKGFYPDPQSCRSFHVCEGDPITSYKLACTSLQIYDHQEKKCARPSLRNRCTSFSCFGKHGRYTTFPLDRSIYTLCADALGTAMFKCPDDSEFDESKQKCVPACKSEESMVDKDDETCKKYYRCVKSGQKFDAVPSSCLGQRVFDPTQLKCVPKESSFKCTHVPAGSNQVTTTLPPTTSENNDKEDFVGLTEESFFRNSQLKESQDHKLSVESNSPSLIDRKYKDNNNIRVTTTATEKGLQGTLPSAEVKTTEKFITSSHSNVDAVSSMLSEKNPSPESHPPSKIVVRETGSLLAQINQYLSNPKNEESTTASPKGSTNMAPTEDIKVATSAQTTTMPNIKDNAEHLTQSSSITTSNTHSDNHLNTLPTQIPNKGQTYKVILNQVETTSSHIKLPTTTHISSTQHSLTGLSSSTNTPPSTKQDKDSYDTFKNPVEVQTPESMPIQIFHTEIQTNKKLS